VGKYECKSEIYMTTNLTVATASGKKRVAFCNLFFSETNNGKWKRSFTTCVLPRFAAKQTSPKLKERKNNLSLLIFYVDCF